MNPLASLWKNQLKELKAQALYRELKTLANKKDFISNDYLSLSKEPALYKQIVNFLLKKPPLSSGGSRLLGGHTPWHQEAEDLFCQYTGQKASLFFNSGWAANTGLITALAAEKTALFSDELNHASLIDGCRAAAAKCYIYPHKNLNKLEELLKKVKAKYKIILTESLFSMWGDKAPLEEISELALRHQALCVVDEAHATGIYGPHGAGFAASLKSKEHIISVHPCGKALAAGGAFIAGTALLKKYLINTCRAFIYTTASSPLQMFYIQCVLKFLKKHPERRQILKQKALALRTALKPFVHLRGEADCPIVPVFMKSSKAALLTADFLTKKGFNVKAVRPPSVPREQALIRLCVHYHHTQKDLKTLAETLKKAVYNI